MSERPPVDPDTPRIAVAGGGLCDESTSRRADEVGRLVAAAGAILLCGGGSGVMAAAARGARDAGGLVIGILPGTGKHDSPPDPAVTIPVFTGLGQARNLVLVLSADVVIAIGGEWGTLSEIALARKHGRPVVLLDSWRLEPPAPMPGDVGLPLVATTPAEAVETALGLAHREVVG